MFKKKIPDSLTSYLTANIQCNKDEDVNFNKLECITGECKNSCAISNEDTSDMSCDKMVYYVFENVNTAAFDRNGKKFQYSRTAHVNKESSLRDLYTQIQELSNGYLVHRFFVQNCKLGQFSYEIFWHHFDYGL